MKIDDITKNPINEAKVNWQDALKKFTNWAIGTKMPVTSDQIDKKAQNDATVRAIAEYYRNKYENIRVSMQKEWGADKVHAKKYRQVMLSLATQEIGANPKYTQVIRAIKTIIDNGDRLDNDETLNAFTTLVAAGIGERIRQQYTTDQISSVGIKWGEPVRNVDVTQPGQTVPSLILILEEGKVIKFNGNWYEDKKSGSVPDGTSVTFEISKPVTLGMAAYYDEIWKEKASKPNQRYLAIERAVKTTKDPKIFYIMTEKQTNSWAQDPERLFVADNGDQK